MQRLYFDLYKEEYRTADRYKVVHLRNVQFADGQDRLDQWNRFQLEEEVKKLAQERFGKDRNKPDGYAITQIGSFFTVDFLYFSPNSLVSLLAMEEEAAK